MSEQKKSSTSSGQAAAAATAATIKYETCDLAAEEGLTASEMAACYEWLIQYDESLTLDECVKFVSESLAEQTEFASLSQTLSQQSIACGQQMPTTTSALASQPSSGYEANSGESFRPSQFESADDSIEPTQLLPATQAAPK